MCHSLARYQLSCSAAGREVDIVAMPAIRKAEPMEPRRRDEEQDAFTILVIARRPNGPTWQSRGFRPVVALPTGLSRRFTPRNDRKRERQVGVSLCFRTVISVTSGHSAPVVAKSPIRLVPPGSAIRAGCLA